MEEFFLDDVNSTQSYAKEKLILNKRDFVVLSKTQTSGRGRVGRQWISPLGGLWFSFDMDFIDNNDLFTIAIGVATIKACREIYGCEVLLKWPNDIILDGKKVGGIICEKINNRVIVGIGINTNVNKVSCENAISFLEVTNKEIDNIKLMRDIIKKVNIFLYEKPNEVIKIFRENMAFVGEIMYISILHDKAKILGVNDSGHLIVRYNGKEEEISMGEISLCI